MNVTPIARQATPWRINGSVLELVTRIWRDEHCSVSFLPDRTDLPLPEKLAETGDATVDAERRRESAKRRALVLKTNTELHSLRMAAKLKLDVAQVFRDDPFYFSYNLDFRGRAYPVSPHLSPLGDEVARGLLQFAEPKPLGPLGLRWLKVHLANLYGNDKVPFAERVRWSDAQLSSGRLRAIADDPMDPAVRSWWLAADKPLQLFAVARDVVAATEAADPAGFLSAVPVHQDGSCNGLQHYAALGRDSFGGAQVNLVPQELPGLPPADVYSSVLEVVKRRVVEDAAAGDDNAKIIDGLLKRKVVKQTVMTSVYGVTLIGAAEQIDNRLAELPQLKEYELRDRRKLAQYLSQITLRSLGEVFTGATSSMKWLAKIAKLVTSEGTSTLTWTTPLGLPVMQPYRVEVKEVVKTISQRMNFYDPTTEAAQKVDGRKQVAAFPPNFVHSLDSSHMLMTARVCRRAGVVFAAVHDSYWTHACDVSEMNHILREQFVELHKRELLQDLVDDLQNKHSCIDYKGSDCENWDPPQPASKKRDGKCAIEGCTRVRLEKAPLPATGDLDLKQVLTSEFFFA